MTHIGQVYNVHFALLRQESNKAFFFEKFKIDDKS